MRGKWRVLLLPLLPIDCVNPDPGTVLEEGVDIVLLGTVESENAFLDRYSHRSSRKAI
jgi:hypothetical protein